MERILKVSDVPFSEISNNERKKIKAVQGTTLALIKQLETSNIIPKVTICRCWVSCVSSRQF
jgi:hypothetical protein